MNGINMLPVNGAWVKLGKEENAPVGRVRDSFRDDKESKVLVRWNISGKSEWIPLAKLRSGFKLGMDVSDVPMSRVRESMGEGVTICLRQIGNRDQVLVEFPESGVRTWLPYENLKQVKGVRHRFLISDTGIKGSAEKFRLRNLAHALELWNENTGSLSHLDIDPLPHQIHLVHHILASANLNWLIADDVGLGKTIEVGMLLSALKQRKKLRRILLVTPAGLTKQWQDELRYKFGMDNFQIYGEDFNINEPHQWKIYDHVIGSIDRFKDEDNLAKLMQAEPWDMIVFDEAHRLSRRQYGKKLDSSQRFRLAASLRKCTDSILLLTATPHQGMTDKFKALLEVLRPEWKKEISRLDLNPTILKHMIIRNNKADVTDAEGNFIFKGKTTKAIRVDSGEESRLFDTALQDYLRRGYAAGKSKGMQGNAIGFVMTIYRKLAASSSAAIYGALDRRMYRLRHGDLSPSNRSDELDSRFDGEQEESFDFFEGEIISHSELLGQEFFDGELSLLEELIKKAEALLRNDLKLKSFLEEIIPSIHSDNPDEKVLVFTEYRATQDHLAKALQKKFGQDCVELINGAMKHQERREAISRFEDQALFLISTEAGGEGINLQRNCHIMVNYDLPWNPMRLVQRIGRLYRYGQQKKVVVFNVHSPQTLDEQVMGLMYDKINQVVRDMAVIGDEYKAGMEDDILGEMADLLDIKDILQEATIKGISRTEKRIEDALKLASEATVKQRELFEFAASFDPNDIKHELRVVSPRHVMAFVGGIFKILGIEILQTTHNNSVWDLRIPETVLDSIPGIKSRTKITFERRLASGRSDLHMMDLDSIFMNYLLQYAKSYDFGGLTAAIQDINGESILTGILRWQNDQGQRMRQEFTALMSDAEGNIHTNPQAFSDWLEHPATDVELVPDKKRCLEIFSEFEKAVEERLAEVSNRDLHPENKQWTSAGWIQKF